MTSFPQLDITVIYSDSGRAAAPVRARTAIGSVSASRLAGALALVTAAAWMFVVWFPVDSYLYKCLMLKTPVVPESVDIGRMLFGGPPPPSLAIGAAEHGGAAAAAPDEPEHPAEDISAYRSPAAADDSRHAEPEYASAFGRRYLPAAVYTWLTVTTIAGVGLALAAGAGLVNWISAPESRWALWTAAAVALLVAAILAFWPKDADAPRMSQTVQMLFVSAFAIAAATLCASLTRRGAGWAFALGFALCAFAAWMLWGRYGIGLPDMAKRAGIFVLLVLAALLGAALSRRWRAAHTLAAGLVVLAALTTLIGLAYGQRIGAFVEFAPSAETYGKALALCAVGLVPIVLGRLAAR